MARHLFGMGGSQCHLLSFVLILLVTSLTSHVDVRHWGHQSFRSFSSGWVVVRRNFCLSCRVFFFFSYVWILLGDHFGYAMRRNRTRVGFLIPREGKFKLTKTHLCYGVESGELYCCRELPAAPSIASIQL